MLPDRLRLLVADDEPLARELVKQYARDEGTLAIVAEASTGDELAGTLAKHRPDVALVDIRMPGEDVFSVLSREATRRPPLPAVIFATAFDSYAVRAFNLNAVDYLIKPVLERSVRRSHPPRAPSPPERGVTSRPRAHAPRPRTSARSLVGTRRPADGADRPHRHPVGQGRG